MAAGSLTQTGCAAPSSPNVRILDVRREQALPRGSGQGTGQAPAESWTPLDTPPSSAEGVAAPPPLPPYQRGCPAVTCHPQRRLARSQGPTQVNQGRGMVQRRSLPPRTLRHSLPERRPSSGSRLVTPSSAPAAKPVRETARPPCGRLLQALAHHRRGFSANATVQWHSAYASQDSSDGRVAEVERSQRPVLGPEAGHPRRPRQAPREAVAVTHDSASRLLCAPLAP